MMTNSATTNVISIKALNHADTLRNNSQENANNVPSSIQDARTMAAQLYRELANKKTGFVSRAVQEQMIIDSAGNHFSKGVFVAQAGTGIGKTLSYVLGALPLVINKQHKLIVSTHTIALQTQLIEKDLPEIMNNLAPTLKVEVSKGSGRYFCPVRAMKALPGYEDKSEEIVDDLFDDSKNKFSSVTELRELKGLIADFNEKMFAGDFDTLTRYVSSRIINLSNRDSAHCPGKKKCSKGDVCPFYIQRDRIYKADIIVTNHALLSYSTLGGHATFSPDGFNDFMLVVDEAHHFPEVIRNVKEKTIALTPLIQKLKRPVTFATHIKKVLSNALLAAAANDLKKLDKHNQSLVIKSEAAQYAGIELNNFLKENFNRLRGSCNKLDDKNQWVLPPESMNEYLVDLVNALTKALQGVTRAIANIQLLSQENRTGFISAQQTKAEKLFNKILNNIDALGHDISDALACLTHYVAYSELTTKQAQIKSGLARWITRTDYKKEGVGFELQANELYVGECFQQYFVKEYASVMLTSATLESLGSIDNFTNRLAIDKHNIGNVIKCFPSPFNYEKAQLSTPIFTGNPNEEKHHRVVYNQLVQLKARHKAILVLFTAKSALEKTFALCSPELKKQILCQQHFSKSELIKQHKKSIDSGETSILFGVDGLSEGIDLPKHYLTCVVITKLPFPRLSSPLLSYETMCAKALNLNAFSSLMLPMCSQKLIQSVGRLIRTEEDHGEVIVLDPRVNTNRYGSQLLSHLPMYKKEVGMPSKRLVN